MMEENLNYFSLSDGIVGLKTNKKHFFWSYGHCAPPVSKDEFEKHKIQLNLFVVDDETVAKQAADKPLGKFNHFQGSQDWDALHYERPIIFNKKLKLHVSGLNTNNITIYANKFYDRMIKYRFINLMPINTILTDITNLKLLQNGHMPLHCSAFKLDDEGIAIFAPPNTGKTLSTMTVCETTPRAEFIAEDIAITDGDNIFAVPWTSTYRHYEKFQTSLSTKLVNKLKGIIPPLELIYFGKQGSIKDFMSSCDIANKTKLKHLYILERGDKNIRDLDIKEALQRITCLNRFEFSSTSALLNVAYEYFNLTLDLDKANQTEAAITQHMLKSLDTIKILTAPNANDYAGMILADLQKDKTVSH